MADTPLHRLAQSIKNLVIAHSSITGSSSQKGHVQSGGAPQTIGTSLSAGTDNGFYARADHVHTASYNNLKNVPTKFPPTNHTHSYSDINDMPDVIVDVQLSSNGSQLIFLTDKD